MTGKLSALRRRFETEDAGFTLVELLTAMIIFSMLAAGLLSAVIATSRSVDATQKTTDINEEARVALNRMARELREASNIDAVMQDSNGVVTGLTFEVDFNGNGTIEPNASDPEVLTYCWDPPSSSNGNNGRILLTPSTTPSVCNNPGSLPVLTSDVTSFSAQLRSSLWQEDNGCAVSEPQPDAVSGSNPDCTAGDGITSWQELDAAPLADGVGNQDGQLNLELTRVNEVVIDLTVLKGSHQQKYRTVVDLRNKV